MCCIVLEDIDSCNVVQEMVVDLGAGIWGLDMSVWADVQ